MPKTIGPIVVQGLAEFQTKLRQLGERGRASAAGALFREGERIMAQSKEQVPVDTGALKASGHVEPPQTSGTTVSVDLGYGGPAVDYAIYVHENLTAQHPSGKAKYLEDPMLAWAGEAESRLGDALRKDFESGAAR